MLDLRGTNSPSEPQTPVPTGVPAVGSTNVSFEAPARRSSPILESGAKAPTGKGISHVGDTKRDPIIFVVAIASVAIAGAAGLVASYLVTQQQTKLLAEDQKHATLVAQLTTGTTGENLTRIKTTALQLAVVGQSGSDTPWVSLLDALSGQVPGAVQLNNASFDSTTKKLTLNGNGKTYEDVAKVIASLEASTRFDQVILQNAAEAQTEDSVQVDFALVALYVPIVAVIPQTTQPTIQGGTQ